MLYPDKSTSVGEFFRGQRHGHGIRTFANSDVYDGEFLNDKRHGQGTFLLNGDKYTGAFVDGNFHGRGTLEFGGGKYDGQFADDACDEPTEVHAKSKWMRDSELAADKNEVFLFHGKNDDTYMTIAQQCFDERFGSIRSLFGGGASILPTARPRAINIARLPVTAVFT